MATTAPVQATASEASSRKLHAVTKGYINDPFVHYFANDRTVVNSPLMNRGYWVRTTIFENALVNFATSLVQSASSDAAPSSSPSSSSSPSPPLPPIQVIDVGSGFDTLFFRWASNPTLESPIASRAKDKQQIAPLTITRFVELDVQVMIDAKKRIIDKNPALKELADREANDGSGCKVQQLMACDLRQQGDIVKALKEAQVSPDVPTFVLAECVLVYLPPRESGTAVRTILSHLTNDGHNKSQRVAMASYDMIRPDDRFGQMMVKNLSQVGLNIHSIDKLKTAADHERRYTEESGFRVAKGATMKSVYMSVPREAQVALNKIEMIDDWDEWNIMHEHYCFVQALYGEGGGDITPPFPPMPAPVFGSFGK